MEGNQYGKHKRRAVLHRGNIKSPIVLADSASPFFNYGQGFFETILYENNKLWYFQDHLERMKKTCHDFEIKVDLNEITEDLILGYLDTVKLKNHCSRVKIIYAPIENAGRWDTLVTASPYTRPAKDFTLSIHNEVYDSKLNSYKSLNYHYNLYWKELYKKKDHSDEVLFCNKMGNILEGSYTNILYTKDSVLYYVDKKNHYLHGIMQDKLLEEAEKIEGLTIESLVNGIDIHELKNSDEVMICNSLMTVQNVKKIILDDTVYKWKSSPSSDYLALKLRENMLQFC